MRCLWQLFRACMAAATIIGNLSADEPVPTPQPDPIGIESIRLPMLPSPVGPPAPQPVTKLDAESWYIVESDVPLLVLASPIGFVSVNPDSGPMKIRGKFADGDGKVETRTYQGKYLFTVEAIAKGTVEILVIPAGATDEDQILRRTLAVMGQGPQPPPGPTPGPDPGPDPTPVAKSLSIHVVEDALNRSPDTAILLSAMAYWNALKDEGHDWRLYDVATTEPNGRQAVSDAGSQSLPAIVIRDRDARQVIHVGPLPKTLDEMKALVKRLTGG